MSYVGKSKSRSELATDYGVSTTTMNRWLKEIEEKLKLNSRSILRPIEIATVIEEWGDFRGERDK